MHVVDRARNRLGLEVSTPDERRDRDAAISQARASLDDETIAAIQAAAAQTDIGSAAVGVLDGDAAAPTPGKPSD